MNIDTIVKQIQRISLDIRGYQMGHYNASTRAEKIKFTKRINAAKTELAMLKQRLTEAQGEAA